MVMDVLVEGVMEGLCCIEHGGHFVEHVKED